MAAVQVVKRTVYWSVPGSDLFAAVTCKLDDSSLTIFRAIGDELVATSDVRPLTLSPSSRAELARKISVAVAAPVSDVGDVLPDSSTVTYLIQDDETSTQDQVVLRKTLESWAVALRNATREAAELLLPMDLHCQDIRGI